MTWENDTRYKISALLYT
jgi:hypothetical protein